MNYYRVFGLSKELGIVEFPLVVKLSTGYDVIPINISNELDKKFIYTLGGILKKFLKTSDTTRQRYQGDRVNEVGRRIEEMIVHEMNKLPLSVKRLGSAGYPDIEISYQNLISYLEMKTSSVREKSGFRYFYYTKGDKIKNNARHLLLDIGVTEENAGYWKVDQWRLSDLSKLTVRLKNEFNASKADLMDEKAKIISS